MSFISLLQSVQYVYKIHEEVFTVEVPEGVDLDELARVFNDRSMRECGPSRISRHVNVTGRSFVSDTPSDHRQAAKVCEKCPAQYGCLLYARRELRKGGEFYKSGILAVSGTLAGYTTREIDRFTNSQLKSAKTLVAQRALQAYRARLVADEKPLSPSMPLGVGIRGQIAASRRAVSAAREAGEEPAGVSPVLTPEQRIVYDRNLAILQLPLDLEALLNPPDEESL